MRSAPPDITPKASAASPRTAVACPARSRGAASLGDRGARAAIASVTTPTGRLMKKIARHPAADVRMPPSTGPAAIAAAPPELHTATALARAAGSPNACRTSDSDAGSVTAAAQPWTIRQPMRAHSAGASPHPADAAVNTTRPQPSIRRAPARSDTAPAEMSRAANGTV